MLQLTSIGASTLAAAVALGSSMTAAQADILLVPGQYPTIQAAMDAAQEGDTVLVADGVYSGPGNTFLSFNGRGFLVRSENGPASCIIDCEGNTLAFWFVADEPPTAVVDGFTVRNGNGGSGGAVFLHHDGQPTFRSCVFTGNVGSYGGAILAENASKLTLIDCTFSQNRAIAGGAVLLWGSASADIVNCTFLGNSATADGGAVWAGSLGLVTVRSCTLARNTASQNGGAILARSGTPAIRGCTFADNTAGSFGGALACIGPSDVALADSILWSDSAPGGPEIALLTDDDYGGAALTVRYSDVQGGQAAILVQLGSTLVYGPGNLDLDPLFVDAPGGDYHIALTSPARDAGDPAALPLPSKLDIDGDPRFFPPRLDMGSDEVHVIRAAR